MKFRIVKTMLFAKSSYISVFLINNNWYTNNRFYHSTIEEVLEIFEDADIDEFNICINDNSFETIYEFNNIEEFKDQYPEYYI